MKIIISENYLKLSKSKYPKSETEPTNPWAVCNKSTGGKKKSPAKFERCVQHVKRQNRKKNKTKDMKPSKPGEVYTPEVEKRDDEIGYNVRQKGQIHRKKLPRDRFPENKGPIDDEKWKELLEKIKKNK